MAERYIHGFYTPDVFCALVVRASKIPMDDHDKKVIYKDMLDTLKNFLTRLEIGKMYSLSVLFRTVLDDLHVLKEQRPDLRGKEGVMVIVGRLDGFVHRLDEEFFVYNQRVEDGGKSDTFQ